MDWVCFSAPSSGLRENGGHSGNFAVLRTRGLGLDQMPSWRELSFPCVSQGVRMCRVLGTAFPMSPSLRQSWAGTDAGVRPLDVGTRTSRTSLLRATSGDFLEDSGDRFDFSVHSATSARPLRESGL